MKFISKVDEKRDVIGHLRIVTQHVMNRSSNIIILNSFVMY